MTKDPERIRKRAEAAAKLGITEEELRAKRAADDALHLERRASEAGVPIDRYLADKRRERNKTKRAATTTARKATKKASKTSTAKKKSAKKAAPKKKSARKK